MRVIIFLYLLRAISFAQSVSEFHFAKLPSPTINQMQFKSPSSARATRNKSNNNSPDTIPRIDKRLGLKIQCKVGRVVKAHADEETLFPKTVSLARNITGKHLLRKRNISEQKNPKHFLPLGKQMLRARAH